MGKGMRLFEFVAKETVLKPAIDLLKESKRYEDRKYASLLTEADRMIQADLACPKTRTIEVHQPFDPLIHYHDIW